MTNHPSQQDEIRRIIAEMRLVGVGSEQLRRLIDGYADRLEAAISAQQNELTIADYEEVLADHRRLVKQLDVLLFGEGGAQQPSLCDVVGKVEHDTREPVAWRIVFQFNDPIPWQGGTIHPQLAKEAIKQGHRVEYAYALERN